MEVGKPFFHRLNFRLQLDEVGLQLGELLGLGWVATMEAATAAGVTSARTATASTLAIPSTHADLP